MIDYLKNRVRPLFYSTGLPPGVAASNREALALVDEEPERRDRLRNLGKRLRKGLAALGFSIIGETTPIVPLIIGDAERALQVSEALFEAGILAPAIRPPSVPEGTSRIRLSLMALHQEEHVDRLLDAVSKACKP
jgi:8-amino-7-oxononanoate synthase